jgi:hypothetical protein
VGPEKLDSPTEVLEKIKGKIDVLKIGDIFKLYAL